MGRSVSKVSVLMPSYNSAPYLREAIESIRCQTFQDFELIIVDDGSDDHSAAILAECSAEDSRIRIIRNDRNRGIVYSLNRGLRACRGEYVARMDADDIAVKERLEKQVVFLDKHKDVIVLGGAAAYVDRAGKELDVVGRSQVNRSLIYRNPMLHPTIMLRRQVLEQLQLGYLEKYRYAEDYFLWLQLSRSGKLAAQDEIILKYRLSGSATRMKHLKKVLWATLKVKTAGVFQLGIRPEFLDVIRFFSECILLLLPSFIVRSLYLRFTFGRNIMRLL